MPRAAEIMRERAMALTLTLALALTLTLTLTPTPVPMQAGAELGAGILTSQWADAEDEVDLGELFLGISMDDGAQ